MRKKTFQEIDEIKTGIIELYKSDFAKIDPSGRISSIFESVPSQLALKKSRFVLSNALKKKRTSKDESLLYDLIDSKTALPCYRIREPRIPLNLTKDFGHYKLYLCDVVKTFNFDLFRRHWLDFCSGKRCLFIAPHPFRIWR